MSQPAPVWPCCPDEQGNVRLEEPRRFKAYARLKAGKRMEVVLRSRTSQRSVKQNRWNWFAVSLVASELGYDKHERDTLHYALVEKCFGSHWDEALKVNVPNVRSSHLTTKQFAEYMEWLVRFAATELDIIVPLPDDVDLDSIPGYVPEQEPAEV